MSAITGVLNSNLYNGALNTAAVSYLLEKKIDNNIENKANTENRANNTNATVYFNKQFNKEEAYTYNNLLDKLDLSIDDIIVHIELARSYFIDYEISKLMYIKIDRFANNIGGFVWYNLTKKPDYNLCLFANRMLPYYSTESKEWKKAGLDANKEDYPKELTDEFNINSSNKDYKDELLLIDKNNNFLEVSVLDKTEYPDLLRYERILKFLVDNNLNDQAIIMACRLMLSYRDCHIIKKRIIWDILKNVEELKKYCMYYCMYLLRHEETIMFNNIDNKSRIVFTLEEAHNMPNYSMINLDTNPYVTQLTDNTNIYKTIPFHLHGKRSINSREEFNNRFKLVTGGIFEGINLRELNAAVTGSILIPCVLKSPLEHDFNSVNWNRERVYTETKFPYMIDMPTVQEEEFINYVEYYYPSYVSLPDNEFYKEVFPNKEINLFEQIDTHDVNGTHNVNELKYEDSADNSAEVDQPKINKILNNKENKSTVSVVYNKLADIDISITTRDINDFKNKVYILFNKIKSNAAHRGEVYINEITTIASVKYKIYGPGIPRPIDVFRIPYEPIKMIKKFHTNIVKMYYDGDLYLLRSCVSTLLSGIGENYKWFSCNKAPADVLLKYAQRGISIILNSKERNIISHYVNINERWSTLFKNIKVTPEKMFCTVTERHAFFRPGLFNAGIRFGLRNFERSYDGIYNNTLSTQSDVFNIDDKQIITHTTKKIYQPEYRLINEVINSMNNMNNINV